MELASQWGARRTVWIVNLEGFRDRVEISQLIVGKQVFQRLLGEVGLADQGLVLLGLGTGRRRLAVLGLADTRGGNAGGGRTGKFL